MTYTWNSAFVATPDEDSGLQRYTGRYINQHKAALDERLSLEHNFEKTDPAPQADHGIHLQGSTRPYYQTTTPVYRPDGFTPLNAADTGRLWYKSDTGVVYQWTGAAWENLIGGIDGGLDIDGLLTCNAVNGFNVYAGNFTPPGTGGVGSTTIPGNGSVFYVSVIENTNPLLSNTWAHIDFDLVGRVISASGGGTASFKYVAVTGPNT